MQLNLIFTLASKEVADATRNRWFWLYAAAFTVLSLGLACTALLGSGFNGLAGFGRTTASMINLVLLVVPLMGLTAGTQSLAQERERGTLAYLLAQPLSRSEVFLGKYLGQALALGCSLTVGFGLSGLALSLMGAQGAEMHIFVTLLGLSLLLAWASLGLGLLVATLVPRVVAAIGTAVLVWFSLAFLGDLGLMGAAVWTRLGAGPLFHLSLANPLQVFRMASVLALRSSLESLGPAGLYAFRLYGANTMGVLMLVMTLWVLLPAALSWLIFSKRSLA